MKSLLSIRDLNKKEIVALISTAKEIKKNREAYENALKHKILLLLFEKPSTRTKISFESAIIQLGGSAICPSIDELQLSRGESMEDTARILGKYVDAICARVYSHQTLEILKKCSGIPVINALSDLEHPTQILSDLMTISEVRDEMFRQRKGLNKAYNVNSFDFKLAYIGDCNNVCNSLLMASSILNFKIAVACPESYCPDLKKLGIKKTENIEIYSEPKDAAKNADILYTDVWVSMGQEKEKEKRMKVFRKYQINDELINSAKKNCKIMHCMPYHIGLEITKSAVENKNSIIFQQSENKLFMEKAILLKFIKS